jgi:hypothetical protein
LQSATGATQGFSMIFKLFKRNEPPPPKRKPAAPPARSAARRTRPGSLLHEPPPVGEVQETHDESAWDLWEQSQFQLDSQLGTLSPADSVRVRQDRPSQFGELDADPFDRVGKNHR